MSIITNAQVGESDATGHRHAVETLPQRRVRVRVSLLRLLVQKSKLCFLGEHQGQGA